MTPAEMIRHAMTQQGMLQRDLAASVGASAAYISDLLHGSRRLSPGMAVRLARVLPLSARSLLVLQVDEDLRQVRGEESGSA